MVVVLQVCTRWSLQSGDPDLEPHEKLPSTERIGPVTKTTHQIDDSAIKNLS